MELINLWVVVRRWWWLIVIPAAVALILALPGLSAVISPPLTYTVGVRFTASQPPQGEGTFEDQSYIPWLASEYAVINLAAWLKTDSFARETAALLKSEGVELDPNTLRSAINSDAVRSVMGLYLNWHDPAQLERIAAAAIQVLQTKNSQYFPQLAAAQTQITALDGIIVAPVAPPITSRIAPLLRILLGLGAGIGLAFLAEYLDPRIRTRSEAERIIGTTVIGEIPRSR